MTPACPLHVNGPHDFAGALKTDGVLFSFSEAIILNKGRVFDFLLIVDARAFSRWCVWFGQVFRSEAIARLGYGVVFFCLIWSLLLGGPMCRLACRFWFYDTPPDKTRQQFLSFAALLCVIKADVSWRSSVVKLLFFCDVAARFD